MAARLTQDAIPILAERLVARERMAVAKALNLVDNRRGAERGLAALLFESLSAHGLYDHGHIIGLTGPPGAGKSTLASALISYWSDAGKSVGVLAVDPSSPISGGALLGDRLRMLASDLDSVFIRSLSTRGEKGGLSPEVLPMSRIMLAAFDVVLLETVGVGQTEVDVAHHADTTVLMMQPDSGDTVQIMKAGIMEIPDVIVVGKADLGEAAVRMQRDLRAALPARHDGNTIPVVSVSALKGDNIAGLAETLETQRQQMQKNGTLTTARRLHESKWAYKRLIEEFGTHGVAKLGGKDALLQSFTADPATPFNHLERLRARLHELCSFITHSPQETDDA